MNIDKGQTGTTVFLFEAPNIEPGKAQITYRGQEPYSYGKLTGGDVVALYDWDSKKALPKPKPTTVVGIWKFQLNESKWDGSTVTLNLTITNLGERQTFGYPSDTAELTAIDSTDKMIKAWRPEPTSKEEFLNQVFSGYPYQKEYYPNESWTGDLKFIMSPYSGETSLYYGQYYWTKTYKLFDLGSPQ
ncbi:MAG: hypothetical protein C4555_06955 [Dehalococcoidia bacterium]|nr:MAG: hypothetical protein C4555_06955 [Dehalococcoidia bacterium]